MTEEERVLRAQIAAEIRAIMIPLYEHMGPVGAAAEFREHAARVAEGE